MISQRVRENRRVKSLKLPKNIERLYREGKCRDCAVVVTRMDFAKILGKFTKVKIQYESSSTPKTKKNAEVTSPNSNTRLKSNENGMVLIRRNAYSPHPVKELLGSKKSKTVQPSTPKPTSNVLKENNRLKKTPLIKDKNSNISIAKSNEARRKNDPLLKQYGIIFDDPSTTKNNDIKSKITLLDLLPSINKTILPTEEWCIDYLPRTEEPKNDKVYDRIAAELEDLMFNEKPSMKTEENSATTENKVDEFPSIMDILNDNTNVSNKSNDQSPAVEYKPSVETNSDVEAILLGKSANAAKESEATAMEVDPTDMTNLIEDVAQLNAIQVHNQDTDIKTSEPIMETDNPQSPSILDEALQKGIEEHLPSLPEIKPEYNNESVTVNGNIVSNSENIPKSETEDSKDNECKPESNSNLSLPCTITHLIFKKNVNGECVKCVTCPKSLKYGIELNGKSVEFLGAPKFISSSEDLQVLLQIVNETELKNVYVCH